MFDLKFWENDSWDVIYNWLKFQNQISSIIFYINLGSLDAIQIFFSWFYFLKYWRRVWTFLEGSWSNFSTAFSRVSCDFLECHQRRRRDSMRARTVGIQNTPQIAQKDLKKCRFWVSYTTEHLVYSWAFNLLSR